MDERTLARLRGSHDVFRRMIALAGVQPSRSADPYYDEMLVRLTPDAVETPAGSTTSSLATYCTVSMEVFDYTEVSHDGPVTAIFDIVEVLEWLSWVDRGSPIEVRFEGDPETGNVSHLVLDGGRVEARVDCYRDTELLAQITFELPQRFTEDERFVLEDGSLAPTVVETTARELERIAAGIDLDVNLVNYPFVVEDGDLRVDLSNGNYRRAGGTLEATVNGPDVANEYGDGFAAVSETIHGPVTVQTSQDGPLVIVQDRPAYTLRYVVLPIIW
jgi:hypothetical protein